MNYKPVLTPLPFLHTFSDPSTLKQMLGVCLFLAGLLLLSIWKEQLFALKHEERAKFLMFNIVGGSWLVAIFSVCGGIYFLFDSIYKFHS